jgi:LacI family transcriptional regulator
MWRHQKRSVVMPHIHHTPRVLLLIETSRAYGRGIVEGIARYSLENGPWSIQFEDRGLEPSPPAWLREWRGQGIIARTISMKLAKMLAETKLPVVELHGDRRIGTAEITCDDRAMGRMAVEHLLNCGLRQFAFFTYGNAWWTETHGRGFCEALQEQGYDCHVYQPPPTAERAVPVWHERQRPRLSKWLRSLPRPIGIYTAGDLHAVRLLDVCQELNIVVPEEIAILSLGNDPVICETVRPTLSSLDLDARRIGYEAASLLDQKMAGKKSRGVLYTPPSHVAVRQSTGLMIIPDAELVQAIQYIREQACRGIDVSHVAKAVGISRSVLERRFKEHLHRTPKAEMMRVRLERARSLLIQTDKLSKQIAHLCGFASVVYFTKAFRHKMGMTPAAYRRSQRIAHHS